MRLALTFVFALFTSVLWADEPTGVQPYAFNQLVKIEADVTDKVVFHVLSPKEMDYHLSIESNKLRFFAPMPNEDITILYGTPGEGQIIALTTLTVKLLDTDGPIIDPPQPESEIQARVNALQLPADEATQVAAEINKALVTAQDSQDLINRTFSNLKPIVQRDTKKWAPFLTWLHGYIDQQKMPVADFDGYKELFKELSSAFSS